MDRTEKEEYIIGCVSLLSNKLSHAGDKIFPDITFKQWFLLLMISKMESGQEKNINGISEVVGTSRQNIKKMLISLETKGYIVILPLAVLTFVKMRLKPKLEFYIQNLTVMSLLLYYSASIAFGVTYNYLHLLYIALFGACFYCVCFLFAKLNAAQINQKKVCEYNISKGVKTYLVLSGIALFVAWLPDIITSLFNGTSLNLIEVYTTEITYVLDMGVISPLIFLTLHLTNQGSFTGFVLLRMILKVCIGIGIMLPIQTALQMMAGISIPIPATCKSVAFCWDRIQKNSYARLRFYKFQSGIFGFIDPHCRSPPPP